MNDPESIGDALTRTTRFLEEARVKLERSRSDVQHLHDRIEARVAAMPSCHVVTRQDADPRRVPSRDPHAVLRAWGGDSLAHCSVDLGGWTGHDAGAFVSVLAHDENPRPPVVLVRRDGETVVFLT
jgi:hypothetical protein